MSQQLNNKIYSTATTNALGGYQQTISTTNWAPSPETVAYREALGSVSGMLQEAIIQLNATLLNIGINPPFARKSEGRRISRRALSTFRGALNEMRGIYSQNMSMVYYNVGAATNQPMMQYGFSGFQTPATNTISSPFTYTPTTTAAGVGPVAAPLTNSSQLSLLPPSQSSATPALPGKTASSLLSRLRKAVSSVGEAPKVTGSTENSPPWSA